MRATVARLRVPIYIYNTYILFSSFAYIYIYYNITITIHNFEDTKFTLAFSRVFLVFLALTCCCSVYASVCICEWMYMCKCGFFVSAVTKL